MYNLNQETISRIEGLTNSSAINNLEISVLTIKSDMLKEGFEPLDVALYLEQKISAILSK